MVTRPTVRTRVLASSSTSRSTCWRITSVPNRSPARRPANAPPAPNRNVTILSSASSVGVTFARSVPPSAADVLRYTATPASPTTRASARDTRSRANQRYASAVTAASVPASTASPRNCVTMLVAVSTVDWRRTCVGEKTERTIVRPHPWKTNRGSRVSQRRTVRRRVRASSHPRDLSASHLLS